MGSCTAFVLLTGPHGGRFRYQQLRRIPTMTDEELLTIYCNARRSVEWEGPSMEDWQRDEERLKTLVGLHAVIAHVRPVPIAAIDQPWNSQGWLNELDMGWMYHPGCGWDLVHVSAMIERRDTEILWNTPSSPMRASRKWAWCLPHWAITIPLPAPEDHFPSPTKMAGEDQS
jgi:hypothetical protein